MAKGKIGTCKMCGQTKKLVRAHLIPEAFYRPMLQGHGYAQLVTNSEGEFNRHLPIGIYDPELVCAACEAIFSPYDDYGQRVLLRTDWKSLPTINGNKPLAHVLESYDRHLLKMFVMAVLWRTAASSRREFGHVNIGPHLAKLTAMIRANESGDVDEWSVMIGRFTAAHSQHPELDPRHCWLDPHCCRFRSLNCVKIYMAEFTIYVKVDSRGWDAAVRMLCLQNGAPLFVMMREFEGSHELALMARMSRKKQSP